MHIEERLSLSLSLDPYIVQVVMRKVPSLDTPKSVTFSVPKLKETFVKL